MLAKIEVTSKQRQEFIDITENLRQQLSKADVKEGVCLLFVPHTTAALTINEGADPDVKIDMLEFLQEMIPQKNAGFRHREGNSDAHIKASLIGPSLQVILQGGQLLLGTWQRIFFCEFDGPRQRQVFLYFK